MASSQKYMSSFPAVFSISGGETYGGANPILKQVSTMNVRLFLILVLMMCAMHQWPAVYQSLTCVEPEPGYPKRLLNYFTVSEIEKICPKVTDLAWRIGNEIFCNLMSVLLTLLLGYVPSAGNFVKENWPTTVSVLLGLKADSPFKEENVDGNG